MLTVTQRTLYEDLMALTSNSEAFYFVDQTLDNTTYRIFSYRLASYSDFCLPNALECRGIMFEVNNGSPVRLAARPPQKFFNYREVSSDINTLAEVLVSQGRLSRDVYERAKKQNTNTSNR